MMKSFDSYGANLLVNSGVEMYEKIFKEQRATVVELIDQIFKNLKESTEYYDNRNIWSDKSAPTCLSELERNLYLHLSTKIHLMQK